MGATLRTGVRSGDHEAAGAAAFTLAGIAFLRGRYRDASRFFAEAQLHYGEHDTFGSLVHVHAYQAGIAAATGDYDGAQAARRRIDAVLDGRDALANQRVCLARADGWLATLRNRREAVEVFLAGAERLDRNPIFAAQLAYEALRAGGNVAPRLTELGERCTAPLVSAYVAHAQARAGADGAALLDVSERFAAIGALRYAMEAATDAARTFVRQGRQDAARRAAVRARGLHPAGQGTEPPEIDGLDGTALELTPREEQVAALVRQGLSNQEIAERLVLSVRSVENYVYRVMRKHGVGDRRDL